MQSIDFLENFYENVILIRYEDFLNIKNIKWIDHGQFNYSQSTAHYFISDNRHYILLSNDYSEVLPFDDDTYQLIKCGELESIELDFVDEFKLKDVTGKFTLYKEN